MHSAGLVQDNVVQKYTCHTWQAERMKTGSNESVTEVKLYSWHSGFWSSLRELVYIPLQTMTHWIQHYLKEESTFFLILLAQTENWTFNVPLHMAIMLFLKRERERERGRICLHDLSFNKFSNLLKLVKKGKLSVSWVNMGQTRRDSMKPESVNRAMTGLPDRDLEVIPSSS